MQTSASMEASSYLVVLSLVALGWLSVSPAASAAPPQENKKSSPKESPASPPTTGVIAPVPGTPVIVDRKVPEVFPLGVIYGPKAAFEIRAPKGWVLDNQSGARQNMPCVLYPEGSTWANAEAVMYAKIASTTVTDRDKFIDFVVKQMSDAEKDFGFKRIAEGKTPDGHAYVVNDYTHGDRSKNPNSRFERVAYVQMPGAVAFIVFAVPTAELHKKHADVIQEVVNSFKYTPQFINHKPGDDKREAK